MVMPFFDRGVKYCQDISHEPRAQQLETHSSNVSLSLLGYIISEFRDGPYLGRGDLLFLASDLLGVSLVHAGYSASLITLLGGIDLHITSNHSSKMRNIENCRWILTPHIVNYLKVCIIVSVNAKRLTNSVPLSFLVACLLGGTSGVSAEHSTGDL